MSYTTEKINNMSELFLSADDNNTKLAFEMMDPMGFSPLLITEIFVVWKLSQDREISKKAYDLLLLHGSEALKKTMKRKLELSGKGYSAPTEKKIKANIKKYVKDNELDGIKFARALYKKFDKGISYILDEGSEQEVMDILLSFKEGTSFILKGKALTKMPKAFYTLTDLEEIDLSNNKLTTVGTAFSKFKNLKKLVLKRNCLKKAHKNLAKLSHLEHLDLSANLMEEFPEVLCQLTNLRYLNMEGMSNNNYKEQIIPEAFQNLKKLRFLGISEMAWYNNFTHPYENYPDFKNIRLDEDEAPLNLEPLALAKRLYEKKKNGISYLLKHADEEWQKRIILDHYDPETQIFKIERVNIVKMPKALCDLKIKELHITNCTIGERYNRRDGTEFDFLNQLPLSLEKVDFSESSFLNEALKFLCRFPKLKSITLKRIHIKELPKELGQLEELEELLIQSIGGLKMGYKLYPEFKKLTALKKLTLPRISPFEVSPENNNEVYKQQLQEHFPNAEIILES